MFITLSLRYIYYDLQKLYQDQCELMEERLDIYCIEPFQKKLHVQDYIKETILRHLTHYNTDFNCLLSISNAYVNHALSQMDSTKYSFNREAAMQDSYEILAVLYKYYEVLYIFDTTKNKYDSWFNLGITSIYLLGWSYILFISFATLQYDSFLFLEQIINTEEPFSQNVIKSPGEYG
jgi:hypothetical protein